MSYSAILAGLHARFATVEGINALLTYTPRSIQTTPLLYSLLDSFRLEGENGARTYHYRILHRLLFNWQENEQCELALLPFVNSIPAAVDADPQLGGAVPNGYAEVSDGEAGWAKINNVQYRVLDFYSEVSEG